MAGSGRDDDLTGPDGARSGVEFEGPASLGHPGDCGVPQDRERVLFGVVRQEAGDIVLARVGVRSCGKVGAGQPVVLGRAEEAK